MFEFVESDVISSAWNSILYNDNNLYEISIGLGFKSDY